MTTGTLTDTEGTEIISRIEFSYDERTQNGCFYLFGDDRGHLEMGIPYRLNWDGRCADILIGSIKDKGSINASLVSFKTNGQIRRR
jgi:hypothetical protein